MIFILIGLLGLPVAVLLLTAHEPARRAAAKSAGTVSENYPFRTVMQFMWVRRAAYGPLILGISCYAMLTNGLKAWIPTFLMRTYGWAPAAVGLSFGFILLVFGTIGTVGGGYAASWLRQRGSDAANLLVGTAASLLIMPLCVIAPLMPSGGLALTFYAMAIFLAGVPFGTSAAAVQQITPNRMRGQVSAIYLFWLNLAGIGAGPIVVAFFTDTIFASDSALRYSLVCLAAISAPLAAILFKSAQASVAELIREQEY